ncbi:MAG: hypothetical protein ACFFBJ_03820 [Promethearchaeota archaeon]
MIEIHLYGLLREMVSGSNATEDTILLIESEDDETFRDMIHRLGLDISRIGDCFINGKLTNQRTWLEVVTESGYSRITCDLSMAGWS